MRIGMLEKNRGWWWWSITNPPPLVPWNPKKVGLLKIEMNLNIWCHMTPCMGAMTSLIRGHNTVIWGSDPTRKRFGTYDEKCDFWLVRAPFVLFKSPLNPFALLKRAPNSSKTEIFKNNNFFCLLCHTELCFYHQNCGI